MVGYVSPTRAHVTLCLHFRESSVCKRLERHLLWRGRCIWKLGCNGKGTGNYLLQGNWLSLLCVWVSLRQKWLCGEGLGRVCPEAGHMVPWVQPSLNADGGPL